VQSILITGASGLLGSNLAVDYSSEYQVWGVFHRHHLRLPGVRMIGADLAEPRQASMIIGKVKPDLVVHCAAATDIDRCQREPDWAFRLNRDMAEEVAKAALEHEADLIHISTDAIFSSEEMPHDEQEAPSPNNVYGESKLAGEQVVLAAHPAALVVRTNLFGRNLRLGKSSLAEWFLSKFSSGEVVNGFTDVFFSPVLVNDLGELLLECWRRGVDGILHIGGKDCLSKFEFGQRLAVTFGFAPDLVLRSDLAAASLTAPRSRRLCLNCSRAESILGHGMPSLDQGIEHFRKLVPMANTRRPGSELVS
jgi:dTDP-4-dehydrorhamnose reductase